MSQPASFDEKLSFSWTRRQCRSVYEALCDQINKLDSIQSGLLADQIDIHVAIEVYATDLEAAREAIYFETGMGEEDECEIMESLDDDG